MAEDAIDGVLKDVSKDNPSVIVCSSICETYFCCDEAIDKMSTAKGGFISTISLHLDFKQKVRWNQKADWCAVDSPKKGTVEFDLFDVKSKKANKTNLSVRFLGEVSRP